MRAMTSRDFLALWEEGRNLHALDQGLLAIGAAFPDLPREELADWPLGRRNHALAQIRRRCFGAAFKGWSSCPECGEKLEFEIDGNELAEADLPQCHAPVIVDGRAYRTPTSRDLAQLIAAPDSAEAARLLLQRCLIRDPEASAAESSSTDWTDHDLDVIGAQLALADPLAEILLHFDCPACNASFDEALDLATYLWAEIEALAKRLLREVHTLARAYGWSEAEILSLSAVRRTFYLEALGA
jgi:hypothetical protein